jgi:type IV pilus assembly protein PilQ
MKFVQPRIKIGCLLLLVPFIFMLNGCAGTTPSATKEAKLVLIDKIEPRETDGKTELVISGGDPILQYTSFQLTEPLRLVVDIPDADVRNFKDPLIIGKGPVGTVTPTQMDSIARLEIGLLQAADTKVYQSNGKLIVELAKPADTAKVEAEAAAPAAAPPAEKPAAEVAPVPATAEASKQEKGTATVVTSVKAKAGKDGITVVIAGNGTIQPNTFMLEGKRLVIDIPGAISKVRPSVIPVRKGGLDKVRVGQHKDRDQNKVRVVLDLTKTMEYTVTPSGNTVTIAMNAATTASATAPAAAVPAQEKAAATAAAPVAEKETAVSAPSAAAPPPVPAVAAVPASAPVTNPVQPAAPKESADETPISREDALLMGTNKYTGKKISLDLQDADLITVMRLFAEVANLNIILAPDVKGKVTVRMVKIPWDQAMDIILRMNGLGYVLEENILRIASITDLTKEADELLRSKESKKRAEDLVTRVVSINYTAAKSLEPTLKKSLSARGETVVDERTNTIIVKDIARNIDEVIALIKVLDKTIPQVIIEAKIVEATLNFSRELGVQWGVDYKASAETGNPTGKSFPNTIGITGPAGNGVGPSGQGSWLVNLPAAIGQGAGGGIGFTFGSLNKAFNLDLVLSALETTGEGKVISTPRVSALDNKEARISQGVSIPYLSVSSAGTTVQFIDANLELIVTPHVTPDNKIFMKIKAKKNAPDASIVVLGQPSIRKNEAETEILLNDGETAVIGGILIIDRGTSESKVPLLGDLPLIGWLFRINTANETKRELLIFIRPNIVKPEVI